MIDEKQYFWGTHSDRDLYRLANDIADGMRRKPSAAEACVAVALRELHYTILAAKGEQMSNERHFLGMWSQEQFYDKAREIVSSVISVQGDNQRATKKVMTLLEDIEDGVEHWIGRNGPGVNPIITSEKNVYMRAKAHRPPLRFVRDLEPGYWLVRWRDVYNDGYTGPWEDWHVMQIDGEAPFLKAMLLMPLSLNPIPPVNIGELLEASDADERVQFAGPIRPPDTDT